MASPSLARSLQRRISDMQSIRLDDQALPTPAALAPLLPGGTLKKGASYSVRGSWQLALAFLAEASTAGSWCGVIGNEAFGAEAAADLGIALDRLALIPHPGTYAAGFAASLAEVLTIVVLACRDGGHPREVERMSAKLREHGSALIVVGDWPRTEAALTVTDTRWHGLSAGHGMLQRCDLTVRSRDRRGLHEHIVTFAGGALASIDEAPVRRLVPR